VGTKDLVGITARFGKAGGSSGEAKDLSVVEAYGELNTELGKFQFGMIPIGFGLEGRDKEEQLWFPRGLLYQKRYIGLRDLGLSYQIKHKSYYTRFLVHNGEGGSDLDNRTWFTAQWGIINERKLDLGISAQVGETTAESTNVAGNASTDIFFDSVNDTKIRLSNFYAVLPFTKSLFRAEVYLAEILKEPKITDQFSGWYAEFKQWAGSRTAILLRHEELRESPATGISKFRSSTLGLAWHNWNRTSTIFLYAIKNKELPTETQNDEFKLV
jgi:hypothetical protein